MFYFNDHTSSGGLESPLIFKKGDIYRHQTVEYVEWIRGSSLTSTSDLDDSLTVRGYTWTFEEKTRDWEKWAFFRIKAMVMWVLGIYIYIIFYILYVHQHLPFSGVWCCLNCPLPEFSCVKWPPFLQQKNWFSKPQRRLQEWDQCDALLMVQKSCNPPVDMEHISISHETHRVSYVSQAVSWIASINTIFTRNPDLL